MRKLLILLMFALPLGPVAHSQNIDIDVLKTINLHRPKSLDNTFLAITKTAKPLVVAIPVGLFFLGLIKKDKNFKYNAVQLVGGLAVTTVVTLGLKYGIGRPRPYVTHPFIQHLTTDGDPSFPSGHAAVAFATATFLSLNYRKWYVIAPSFLWAAAVAYSRMDLGVHYPSDVLAGAIIGAASFWLSYKAEHWINQRYYLK